MTELHIFIDILIIILLISFVYVAFITVIQITVDFWKWLNNNE